MSVAQNPESDEALLRAWADARSADAFEAIVRRHGGMVRGIATRALGGDAVAADDVAQAVFVLLAQRAARLRVEASLAPWLHATTRYAAANARRALARRARHERAAAAQRTEVAVSYAPVDDSLDEAVARLREGDRLLILERFVRGREVTEIAVDLGTTTATAQRRLSRAVDRLRALVARRDAGAAATLPASLAALRGDALPSSHIERYSRIATGGDASASVGAIVSSTRFTMMRRSAVSAARWVLLAMVLAALAAGSWQAVRAQPVPPPPVVAATRPAEAASLTADAIVGQWRFVAARANGRAAPADQLGLPSVTITAGEIVVATPGRSVERMAYVLRPGESFAEFDFRDAANPTRVVPGIAQLVGDELSLAFDDQNLRRPTSFDRPGRAKVWVLRRLPTTRPTP